MDGGPRFSSGVGQEHQDAARARAGTMLFGESTEEGTAWQLLDACMDAGVNFFDTAEMYPVPQSAASSGRSEEILGRWMRRRRR